MSGGTFYHDQYALTRIAELLRGHPERYETSDDIVMDETADWMAAVLDVIFNLVNQLDRHYADDAPIDNPDLWTATAKMRLRDVVDAPPGKPSYMDGHALDIPWRVAANDLIGGWCIVPLEGPSTPATGAMTIADFITQDAAKHIVELHNGALMEKPVVMQRLPSHRDMIEAFARARERTPLRIAPLIYELHNLWQRHPDLRLTQLLWVLANTGEHAPDFFMLDDDALLTRISQGLTPR
jgi:hypothetical protein